MHKSATVSSWCIICYCLEIVGSQIGTVAADFKPPAVATTAEQVQTTETRNSSTPPCGKICSYDWDRKEEGKYYPLLHKTVNCPNTLYRMAHSPYQVVRPPPRRPPPDLLRNYTIDGQCPISKFGYRDDSSTSGQNTRFDQEMFRKLLERENVTNINYYHDRNVLKPALMKYRHLIRDKRVAVVGTVEPWAEAMLMNLGASNVTTVEYKKLVIEHEKLTTTTPHRLAEQFIGGNSVPFDTVFSYGSVDHTGLGRYGDPLTPFGDLEATAEIWCMVKPGGHLVLAVRVSDDRK